ncbi:MAG: hypothetical protein ACRENX_07935 [Candidatus Dormibacteria bacterium]
MLVPTKEVTSTTSIVGITRWNPGLHSAATVTYADLNCHLRLGRELHRGTTHFGAIED